MSTALSSNMLYVYACTKSLLCLSWYADGMGCDGKGPKHVHGLFLIACLPLNWCPGANKQLVLLFCNGTCWETEKNPPDMKGRKWVFPGHYSEVFLLLLMDFPILFFIYCGANKAALYAASLPIQYLFLTTLIYYFLPKMQIMIKTNRNSSNLPQWDLDEHCVEQHVYPSVSSLDHVPSEKRK